MRIGWGDESGSSYKLDPHTYILSVVLADESHAGQIRNAMASLLLRGQKKVHWRDESDRRRDRISAEVSKLPIEGLVVIRSNKPDDRPERRRRKCMERLLWELNGCDRLILESRGLSDDRRDRELMETLRRRHGVPKGLHADHVAGPSDPALWAADALCGAIVGDRLGQPGCLSLINSSIKIRFVEID